MALFVIGLKTGRGQIAGIIAAQGGIWMEQVARNLVDREYGLLLDRRYLVQDRDPSST